MGKTSEFKGRTFLVTGGAGFIGSHIVEELLAVGARVIVLDDMSNGKGGNLPSGNSALKVIDHDVRTFEFDLLGKVDCVFNEAARALLPSFVEPVTDLNVNTAGFIRVLEYARHHGAKVVHASSGSVYGNPVTIPISEDHPLNPISPYGVSKLASEFYGSMYQREFGVDVVMLRYFNVYGPRQTVNEEMGVIPIFVHKAIRKERLRVFGDGKQTRDFLNVKDVVNANFLAYLADHASGQIMNVGGGGHEISILDLALKVMEMCDFRSSPVFADPKPGDIRRLVADNSKANRIIGYSPTVSLEQGLKRYIEFTKTNG
jgi:UDP-glucose 4-epimerase